MELTGQSLDKATKVLIMLHGRGDSAGSFINLSRELDIDMALFAVVALQAPGNTWYPYSFLMPLYQNEPKLSESLSIITGLVVQLKELDFKPRDIYFLGFSQGACLALEFCARNAEPYGGIVAFTGGLLGDTVHAGNYHGDFNGTHVFIGASNNDPHVPESRIEESKTMLSRLGAKVSKKIYPGMGHTINDDELEEASLVLNS